MTGPPARPPQYVIDIIDAQVGLADALTACMEDAPTLGDLVNATTEALRAWENADGWHRMAFGTPLDPDSWRARQRPTDAQPHPVMPPCEDDRP